MLQRLNRSTCLLLSLKVVDLNIVVCSVAHLLPYLQADRAPYHLQAWHLAKDGLSQSGLPSLPEQTTISDPANATTHRCALTLCQNRQRRELEPPPTRKAWPTRHSHPVETVARVRKTNVNKQGIKQLRARPGDILKAHLSSTKAFSSHEVVKGWITEATLRLELFTKGAVYR